MVFESITPAAYALACFYNKISSATGNKEYSVGIFVDLSKAFDTVDHNILVLKLEHLWCALVQKLSKQ